MREVLQPDGLDGSGEDAASEVLMAHKDEKRREKIEARAKRLHEKLFPFLRYDINRRLIVAALLRQRREALDEAAAVCGVRHRQYREKVALLGDGTTHDPITDPYPLEIAAREALRLSEDIATLKCRVARRGRKR